MPPPDHRPDPGREPITEIMGTPREPPLLSGYGTRTYDTAPMATVRTHSRAGYWLASATLAAASAFVLLVLPGLREPTPKDTGAAVPETSSVQATAPHRTTASRPPPRTTTRSTPPSTRTTPPPTSSPPPPTSTSTPLQPLGR